MRRSSSTWIAGFGTHITHVEPSFLGTASTCEEAAVELLPSVRGTLVEGDGLRAPRSVQLREVGGVLVQVVLEGIHPDHERIHLAATGDPFVAIRLRGVPRNEVERRLTFRSAQHHAASKPARGAEAAFRTL